MTSRRDAETTEKSSESGWGRGSALASESRSIPGPSSAPPPPATTTDQNPPPMPNPEMPTVEPSAKRDPPTAQITKDPRILMREKLASLLPNKRISGGRTTTSEKATPSAFAQSSVSNPFARRSETASIEGGVSMEVDQPAPAPTALNPVLQTTPTISHPILNPAPFTTQATPLSPTEVKGNTSTTAQTKRLARPKMDRVPEINDWRGAIKELAEVASEVNQYNDLHDRRDDLLALRAFDSEMLGESPSDPPKPDKLKDHLEGEMKRLQKQATERMDCWVQTKASYWPLEPPEGCYRDTEPDGRVTAQNIRGTELALHELSRDLALARTKVSELKQAHISSMSDTTALRGSPTTPIPAISSATEPMELDEDQAFLSSEECDRRLAVIADAQESLKEQIYDLRNEISEQLGIRPSIQGSPEDGPNAPPAFSRSPEWWKSQVSGLQNIQAAKAKEFVEFDKTMADLQDEDQYDADIISLRHMIESLEEKIRELESEDAAEEEELQRLKEEHDVFLKAIMEEDSEVSATREQFISSTVQSLVAFLDVEEKATLDNIKGKGDQISSIIAEQIEPAMAFLKIVQDTMNEEDEDEVFGQLQSTPPSYHIPSVI